MSFGSPFLKVSCNVIGNFKDFNAKTCQYYSVLLNPYAY